MERGLCDGSRKANSSSKCKGMPEQEADPADTEKCEASENGTKCVRILICVSVHISKRAYS